MRVLLIVFTFALTISAFAAPPEKDGFSGSFDLGAFGMSSNDALDVNDKNEDIDGIEDSPDSAGKLQAIILFDLKYKKNNKVFHFGTPMESGKPELLAGFTYLKGEASYDISLVISPLEEKWKDPYVTDRSATDAVSAGVRFEAENIAESNFNLELRAIGHDLDKDVIGQRFDKMKRKGSTYSVKLGYGYELSPSKKLTPYVEYTREDRDGEAQSGNGYGLGAKYMQPLGKGLVIPMVSASTITYDKENPIFDKTRKDVQSSALVMYRLPKPFGWEKKHIILLGGVSNRQSNIDFYDATSYFGGVTFGFDF